MLMLVMLMRLKQMKNIGNMCLEDNQYILNYIYAFMSATLLFFVRTYAVRMDAIVMSLYMLMIYVVETSTDSREIRRVRIG